MATQNRTVVRSFNRTLVHAIGTAIGDEARALTQPYCGGTFWAPNVNTVHDPRGGRGQETPVRPIVAALLALRGGVDELPAIC